jgi:DNA-binding NarL/FixJ family response regulator
MPIDNGASDTLLGTASELEAVIEKIWGAVSAPKHLPKVVQIAIIDRRSLSREALVRALASNGTYFQGRGFESIGDWESSPDREEVALILLECNAINCVDPIADDEIQRLVCAHPGLPIVMMGESEDPRHVAEILACGARSYLPSSASLSVAIGVFCLAVAGGSFVPASALRDLERTERGPLAQKHSVHGTLGLTERQFAVANAVALGKPNKIIAYELNVSESTVKVHLRTIMKKLEARNRTEVAFKLHSAKGGGGPVQHGPHGRRVA